jgi:hypothetical protein
VSNQKLSVSGPRHDFRHRSGLAYALPSYLSREKKNVVNVMKIEIPILAGLLFIGNELLARAAVQGVEQALLSTVVEWTMSRVKAAGNIIS